MIQCDSADAANQHVCRRSNTRGIVVKENGEDLSVIRTLEFQNVDFRYGNRELTLKNINLSIYKEEKIAIVGEG